jgi:hypothetical protein
MDPKGLKATAALAKWKFTKWKRKKQFNFENVIKPLMDEVKSASEGDLPGEPGKRSTEWADIGEEVRINMPNIPVDVGDQYQEMLNGLETKEEQKERIGSQFIEDLPGGQQRSDNFLIILDVEQMRDQVGEGLGGSFGTPQDRGTKGELDIWLDSCWSAFEEAESPSELETRIRGLARQSETPFNIEAVRYWEDSAGYQDWEETFWHLYQTGNLRSYYKCIGDIQSYKHNCVESAESLRKWLIKMN